MEISKMNESSQEGVRRYFKQIYRSDHAWAWADLVFHCLVKCCLENMQVFNCVIAICFKGYQVVIGKLKQ
jgi:hypothetical protein